MRLLIIIGLVLSTVDNFACSCGHVGITENRKAMNYVFKGRVSELSEIVSWDTLTGTNETIEYRRVKYTFEVLENYKGLKGEQTVDLVTSGMTDCGFSFDKNKIYIVYAYYDNKKLHHRLMDQKIASYVTTHLCTRTKKITALSFWETFVLWLT